MPLFLYGLMPFLQGGKLSGSLSKLTDTFTKLQADTKSVVIAIIGILGVISIAFAAFKFVQAVTSSQQRGKNIMIALFALIVGATLVAATAFEYLEGLGNTLAEPFTMIVPLLLR